MSKLIDFGRAVARHYVALSGGILASLILAAIANYFYPDTPQWVYVALVSLCLIGATFMAWSEEQDRRIAAEQALATAGLPSLRESIAALQVEVTTLRAGRGPRRLTDSQKDQILTALPEAQAGILIQVLMGDPRSAELARDLVEIFKRGGWEAETGQYFMGYELRGIEVRSDKACAPQLVTALKVAGLPAHLNIPYPDANNRLHVYIGHAVD